MRWRSRKKGLATFSSTQPVMVCPIWMAMKSRRWSCSLRMMTWPHHPSSSCHHRSRPSTTRFKRDFWATNGRDQAHARSFTGRREPISEAPYSNVVDMAGVGSSSSRSLDQDPILAPCGRSCYWTCQTRTTHLAELHWEIARKAWKTFQRNCGHGTLAHTTAEGMHAGLVQLVQSAKDLQNCSGIIVNHCELCEIRLPPEYQAASSVKETFLLWPSRFMALLEIHL